MKKITRSRLEKFLKKYATQNRILDIGSGGSSYDRFFPNRLTIDIDPARKPDVIANAHDLPFKDAEFPEILCTEVLEHLTDPARAIAEMNRVLQPGGILILTTRFVYPVHDAPGDYWRFTPYGLQHLFGQWDILEILPETDAFSTVAVLLQRIIFQSNLRGGKVTKGFIYLLMILFNHLDPLLINRYGNIKKSSSVEVLMSSGLYLVCRKK